MLTNNQKKSNQAKASKQITLMALMLCLSLGGTTLAAMADNNKPAASIDESFAPDELKQVPPLPDFPAYGGRSTFLHGVVYANAPGGVSYTYLIGVPDSPPTVKAWYQAALKGNQWSLEHPGANQDVISARKNGNYCNVEVKPPMRQGDGARIMVIYHAVKPVSLD